MLNRLVCQIFGVVLLLGSGSAFAQTKQPYETAYDKCVDEHGAINNGVVEVCSDRASTAAKKSIQKFYNAYYKFLQTEHPEDAIEFENAQKAWLVYRDKHCQLMTRYVGSPMFGYCPMNLNIDRANQLRELLEGV